MRKKIFIWFHDIFCILSTDVKMVAAGALVSGIWNGNISPYYYILVAFLLIDGFISIWETTRYV